MNERFLWWEHRRGLYLFGLVVAGILAFISYALLGEWLIAPYDHQFEITLFTIFFQGIAYLAMMFVANLCYYLGYFVDKRFNTADDPKFRVRLFNLGLWFSVSLPFLVPLLIVVQYFLYYAGKPIPPIGY